MSGVEMFVRADVTLLLICIAFAFGAAIGRVWHHAEMLDRISQARRGGYPPVPRPICAESHGRRPRLRARYEDGGGVPFEQTRFLPEALEGKLDLSQFLEMEGSWPATNRERGQLIDKNIAGTITAEERARLDALQAYADYRLQKVSPRPTLLLDELERRLGDQQRRS